MVVTWLSFGCHFDFCQPPKNPVIPTLFWILETLNFCKCVKIYFTEKHSSTKFDKV